MSDISLKKLDLAAAVAFSEEYLRYRPELEDRSIDFYGNTILAGISYRMGNFKKMEEYAQFLLDLALGQNNIDTISALRFLGISWKYQGDYRRSSACILEGLSLCQETKDYPGIYANIAGLAGIAIRLKQPARAARLFGAVDKMLKTIPNPMDPIEQEEFSQDVALTREALTGDEFSRAWAQGQSISTEESLREARTIAGELAG